MTRKPVASAHSRLLSEWEHKVQINLTESAIHPISVKELSQEPQFYEKLLTQPLNYPHTNGRPELRQSIAALYPNSSPDQVVVTIGAAQANFTAAVTLLEPGDEIVLLLPTYKQLGAVAQQFGFRINPFFRREEQDWGINLDDLDHHVTDKTRMIFICNPDNPTGHILTQSEREGLIRMAERCGAWLLVDEVCQGTERITDQTTPTFWGQYDRVITTCSLSKAYGLPGTRIGWVVAPEDIANQIWSIQDYLTISASMISNHIANYALQPEVRARLFHRARQRVRQGYAHLREWIDHHSDIFRVVPPHAAALAFVGYNRPVNSTQLAHRLIVDKSTLVVPGDGFGLDHHLRISFDVEQQILYQGMDNIYDSLAGWE